MFIFFVYWIIMFLMVTVLIIFLSAVFILIASITFGSRIDSIPSTVMLSSYLYVPYGFNIVNGVLCAVAGACMLVYKVEYSSWLFE